MEKGRTLTFKRFFGILESDIKLQAFSRDERAPDFAENGA